MVEYRYNFVGFNELSLPFTFTNGAIDDATNDLFSFDPSTTTAFSERPQPTTVNPGVLIGNGHSLHDDNKKPSDEICNPQSLFTSLPNARTQHGQVTPPDDLSPTSAEVKPALRDIDETKNIVEESTQPAKTDGKRRGSTKAGTARAPKKRRRKTAAGVDDENLNLEEKAKRDQFLKNNREAAHKCRKKKKKWMDQLDDDCRDLSAKNNYLSADVKVLTNTLYDLKNLVFHHTDCGFAPINDFLNTEARRLQTRARVAPNTSMAMQAPSRSSDSFSQPSSSFAGTDSGVVPSIEQASTETSDLESFHPSSTAPDGTLSDSLADMLRSP